VLTDLDLANQVKTTLAEDVAEYDVEAIVTEIQATYGTVDVDTIEGFAYWDIVEKHAK
jgi:hypothetical protein